MIRVRNPARTFSAAARLPRLQTRARHRSARPGGVRAYQTVGGDVDLVRRSTTPSRSSLRKQVVSTLAEIPLRSAWSSEKQRSPSLKYQIASAVQALPISFMHAFMGHAEGGGATFVLRFFTIGMPYRMVTRFFHA